MLLMPTLLPLVSNLALILSHSVKFKRFTRLKDSQEATLREKCPKYGPENTDQKKLFSRSATIMIFLLKK